MNSVLRERLAAAGAAFTSLAEREVVHDFGDVTAEYAAVRSSAGLALRSDLVRLRISGRDPVRMIQGLITNELANAPEGRGVYAAMLTPKGRTVAELRVFRTRKEDSTDLLIDLPVEAAAGTREHLKKFVPPLFARWEEVSDEIVCLGVYGPASGDLLRDALSVDLPGPGEDEYREMEWNDSRLLVARTFMAGLEEGYDLFVSDEEAPRLWDALAEPVDVRPIGHAALETLRIEAGRPRYGHELTEAVIPTEAYQESGLLQRAISFTKGCYTGQEVIVRIAHRGHVNRHLRGILLADRIPPDQGTALHHPETGKPVGGVTSSARSPLLGQTIALALVRREIEPGSTVRIGSPEGELATVARIPFEPAGR